MDFGEIISLLKETFGEEVIVSVQDQGIMPVANVDIAKLKAICQFLWADERLFFDYLACITAVDNCPQANTMEIIYNLNSIPYGHSFAMKVMVDRNQEGGPLPVVPTVSDIWRTADWHEREAYDLFGIYFENHPDLRRILLPEDWEGYPLRKDYKAQAEYHGIRVAYEDRENPAP